MDADDTAATHAMRRHDDPAHIEEQIARGRHRNLVGGLWDEVGTLQFELLRAAGLCPGHRVLDIGCGCLRAGVKLIPYLEPDHYFGIDSEKRLLQAGFRRELKKAGLEERLKRGNLFCSQLFVHQRLPERSVDFGLLVSVITHLPLNHLRICLENVERYFKVGAKLFASYYEIPEHARFADRATHPGGVVTYGHAGPYHCYRSDMLRAAERTRWVARHVGEWGHGRGQVMMEYTLGG